MTWPLHCTQAVACTLFLLLHPVMVFGPAFRPHCVFADKPGNSLGPEVWFKPTSVTVCVVVHAHSLLLLRSCLFPLDSKAFDFFTTNRLLSEAIGGENYRLLHTINWAAHSVADVLCAAPSCSDAVQQSGGPCGGVHRRADSLQSFSVLSELEH